MNILSFVLLLYTGHVTSFTTQPVIASTLISNYDHDIVQKESNIIKKKCFIFVDPLDDFGQTSIVRERCDELGYYISCFDYMMIEITVRIVYK
jgi:hypothetical protein